MGLIATSFRNHDEVTGKGRKGFGGCDDFMRSAGAIEGLRCHHVTGYAQMTDTLIDTLSRIDTLVIRFGTLS